MKALCLVAHPDDCIIFAYSYIYHHPEHDWTIGYLTYTERDPRGAELKAFWAKRGIECVFLGFEDHWEDNEKQKLTRWYGLDAEVECWRLACGYNLILTHDEHGDYGHIHHRLVHNAVAFHHNVVTFAKPGEGTTYSIPPGVYSLDELPQHGKIIAGFHRTEHKNSYKEPKCT